MTNLASTKSTRAIDPRLPRHPTLVHTLAAAVVAQPERTALICEGRELSYARFGRGVAGLARHLSRLEVASERVIVLMPNSIEMAVALLAVMAARAQVAPVNPFFTPRELRSVVADAGARAILCDHTSHDKARALARELGIAHVLEIGSEELALERWFDDELAPEAWSMPGPDDLALLIFSGGSTGTPKGVNHTHRSLAFSFLQHCVMWPVDFGAERFLTVAPMFHIWGLAYATWVPMYAQSTLVIVPKYEPDAVVRALSEHKITIFGGGPAPIYMGLLGSSLFDSADLSALKYCLSGGAPCPEDLHREWMSRTGCALFEGWGMTEGAPLCLNPAQGTRKILSVGNAAPETEIEIVDLETGSTILGWEEPGEVRARGPQIMAGYRNRPEDTAEAVRHGWLYTGDIGYLDREGFLFLVDRKKQMAIVGGYNVFPREVDEVLFNHPKIREAAALGKPDDRLGEVIVAFVVLNEQGSMSQEELFDYCKENLVKYKRPVEVTFVDNLPKTGTRKIDKLALKTKLRE